MCIYLVRYYGEYQVTPVTLQNKNDLEKIQIKHTNKIGNLVKNYQCYTFNTIYHEECIAELYKLTNWHIRLESNIKGCCNIPSTST